MPRLFTAFFRNIFSSRRHARTLLALLFLSVFSLTITYATPPTSPYTPAETLDPACAPGDTNCTVLITDNGGVWGAITGTLSSQTDLQSALDAKQATLVSGTNIKTVNGSTILGSGDVTISGSQWDVVTGGINYSGGLVGIGVTTPTSELDVSGTIASSDLAGTGNRLLQGNSGGNIEATDIDPVVITDVFTIAGAENKLISGGVVTWVSGFTFDISAADYYIDGVRYNSPDSQVTLSAADGTFDRIDVFALTEDEDVVVVEGDPTDTPAQPRTDSGQLPLTFAYIPAGSTTPLGASSDDIYEENTEWTTSTSNGAIVDFNYATAPYAGSKSVRISQWTAGTTLTFTRGSTTSLSDKTLVFYIKTSAAFGSNARKLQLQWLSGSTAVSDSISMKNNDFAFSDTNTGWQKITIPMSSWQVTGAADRLRITLSSPSTTGFTIGFDNISLSGGVTNVPTNSNSFYTVAATTGSYSAQAPHDTISIIGGGGITTSVSGNVLTVSGAGASTPTLQQVTDSGKTTTNDITVANGIKIWSGLNNLSTNIGIGDSTLAAATSTSNNLAIGNNTLKFATTSPYNTAIGINALSTLSTGSGYNVAVGPHALISATTGNSNVVLGAYAAIAQTTANFSVAIGTSSLAANIAGNRTVSIGNSALFIATTASDSVAVGTSALRYATNSTDNTAVGFGGLQGIIVGTNNVGVGKNSKWGTTGSPSDGSYNVALGDSAGYGAPGSGNVYLGYQAGYGVTGDNKLYISNTSTATNLLYGDFANPTIVINGGAAGVAASSAFTVVSTTKGMLTPRMTTIQRNAISSPAEGLIVFDTDVNSLFQYTGSAWENLYNSATSTTWGSITGTLSSQTDLQSALNAKQATLVSGTNIKTVNGTTLLGSGDLTLSLGTTETASNGLTKTSNDIKLGGSLSANTTLSTGSSYILEIAGSNASTAGVLQVSNSSSNGGGLEVYTNGGIAGQFETTSSSTNTSLGVINLMRFTSATAQNGIGAGLNFQLENDSGSATNSNQLISTWTNVADASLASQFVITGVDNSTLADLFTLSGNGALRLNKYGVNTFTGTATYNLAVDSSGNIIEVATGGGSDTTTASNGLTLTSSDVALGGSLTGNTTINTNSYELTFSDAKAGGNVLSVSNTGSANAINASSTTGYAINATSTSGGAISGFSTNGRGLEVSSRNSHAGLLTTYKDDDSVSAVLKLNSTPWFPATPVNGLGGSIDFESGLSGGTFMANQLISQWTDVVDASRTSEFSITGVDTAITKTLLALSGNGAARFNQYGNGTFTGTAAYDLAVDAAGNIIEVATGGGGGGVAWGALTGTLSDQTDLQDALDDKQDTLISASNIKTVNGVSLLGSGNITIAGTGGSSQWTDVTEGIYYDLGNVGIGTTTPTSALTIAQNTDPLGAELITNGTFTGNANDWYLFDDDNGSATYSSNSVTVLYTDDKYWATISTEIEVESGKTYTLSFDLSDATDDVYYYFDNIGTSYDEGPFGEGSHTVTFLSDYTGTETIYLESWNWDDNTGWTVDNVSVKEVVSTADALAISNYSGNLMASFGGFYNNIFIGENAGDSAVVVNSNFLGLNAGNGATNANNANFFGANAGFGATDAIHANFIGSSAGYGATGAAYSNFSGYLAGNGATGANYSNFFGQNAGSGATYSNYSNFFGKDSGQNASSASSSNFFGETAGYNATNAFLSNFLGTSAGYGATNANYSNFFGQNAGRDATNADHSNFFGVNSGYMATGSDYANFIGQGAGAQASNASNSNFIGTAAGETATNAFNSNFIGTNAGVNATDAFSATFIGSNAGNGADSSFFGVFIGQEAGMGATDAPFSNFIGYHTGKGATGVTYGNFIGSDAGLSATEADSSNFMGTGAGNAATNASYSNFIGDNAGVLATNAYNSVFIGKAAGSNAVNSANSIFIGDHAGLSDPVDNTTSADDYSILIGKATSTGGNENSIAMGNGATNTSANQFMIGSVTRPINQLVINGSDSYLNFGSTGGTSGYGFRDNAGAVEYKNNSGSWTTLGSGWGLTGNAGTIAGTNFIGTTDNVSLYFRVNNAQYGFFEAGSDANLAIGYLSQRLIQANGGYWNTAIGTQTMLNATTGDSNTAVGFSSLSNITTGAGNTALGYGSVTTAVNTTRALALGYSTQASTDSIALGAYAVNTASNQFMVGSSFVPIDSTRINGSSSTQCTITTGTGIACTSDERLKTNIAELNEDTLTKLLSVKTVTYNWLENTNSAMQVGFLAQDLEQYFPELVATDSDGYKSVYYAQMTPILVKAIQEMDLKITAIDDIDTDNTWRDALVSWLGNIENGIGKIFAGEVETNKLCVKKADGTSICLTGEELEDIKNGGTSRTVYIPANNNEANDDAEEVVVPETTEPETPEVVTEPTETENTDTSAETPTAPIESTAEAPQEEVVAEPSPEPTEDSSTESESDTGAATDTPA